MSKCIDCKWAFLDPQERLTIKLKNQPELFECNYPSKYNQRALCADYKSILLSDTNCPKYKPCPENT